MRDNIGPKAVARDLRDAAVVIARYAPRLPGIAEKFVIEADRDRSLDRASPAPSPNGFWAALGGGVAGGAVVAGGLWLYATMVS